MNVGETILYMKDNLGGVREWAISCEENVITIRYGQVHGSMQYQREVVSRGKSTRSIDEQLMSRMASRVLKQRDKGYVNNYDEARFSKATNALGMMKPMLAQKIANVKNIDYTDAIAQPKFDGNRCIIHCNEGLNYAYSRNGKPIQAIGHILNDIELEEGQIVDGELYCHGVPLQTIVSWVKREQEDTLKVKYHLYDIASNLPYTARSELIRTIPHGSAISPVYGDSVGSYEALLAAFRVYRSDGYEGAILRWGTAGYEDGKRSKSLVKVKEWHDDEFVVLEIYPSADGWAILECYVRPGCVFRVSAPGSIDEKMKILENKEDYYGRKVTVEYANLTADGIPFHPVAINFRDEIQ